MKLLSIVIPTYCEADNVEPLYHRLKITLGDRVLAYEIIFVDDGSTDGTRERLRQIARIDPLVKIIFFRRNYGQTAALSAGFSHAKGDVVVTLDGDLQNDPADIPKLLAEMDRGYDIVSGLREKRKDSLLLRRFPSYVANRLISWISGVKLQDYGCTLKAYRSTFIKNIHLFGEMHRFIPIYADWMGARIQEIPVQHHPRRSGKSKYGIFRTFKVILDLITVKFLGSFSTKPIYVFGGAGLSCLGFGFITASVSLFQKIVYGVWIHRNPLLLISIFFFLVGFQLILMGLLAEMIIRIYHESQERPTYWIQEMVNIKDEPCAASQDT